MARRLTPDRAMQTMHGYKMRSRKDHRGVDLISDALAFGRLWYVEPNANRQRNPLRTAVQPLNEAVSF